MRVERRFREREREINLSIVNSDRDRDRGRARERERGDILIAGLMTRCSGSSTQLRVERPSDAAHPPETYCVMVLTWVCCSIACYAAVGRTGHHRTPPAHQRPPARSSRRRPAGRGRRVAWPHREALTFGYHAKVVVVEAVIVEVGPTSVTNHEDKLS